ASGGGDTTPAPTVTLSVDPATITAGQSATLTWSTTNAGTCNASGAWSGTQGTNGTQSVSPTTAGANTFTLTCSGAGAGSTAGGTSVSTTLTVNAASGYSATKLLADSAGLGALATDANLHDPRGITFAPGKAAWVANNGTETATLYDGNGKAQPNANPLVVH